jgi:hypothetical protein
MDQKLLNRLCVIMAFVIIMAASPVLAQQQSVKFKDKPYYSKLFDKKAQSKLTKADKYLAKWRKFNIKTSEQVNLRIPLDKKLKEKITDAEKSKVNKKIEGINKKIYKYSLKAYQNSGEANLIKQLVYAEALIKAKKGATNVPQGILQLENGLVLKFQNSQKAVKESIPLKGDPKLDKLQLADEYDTDAIGNYETILGYYMGDKDIVAKFQPAVVPVQNQNKEIVQNKEVLPIQNQTVLPNQNQTQGQTQNLNNNATISQQNQTNNQSVYQLGNTKTIEPNQNQEKVILPALNLVNVQKETFRKANQDISDGVVMLKEGRLIFNSLDSLTSKISATSDEKERTKLKSELTKKGSLMETKNLQAVNLLLNANKSKYQIYSTQNQNVRLKEASLERTRAIQLDNEAKTFAKQATDKILVANKQGDNTDKFIKLMEANEHYLSALALVEKSLMINLRKTGMTDEDIKLAKAEATEISSAKKEETVSNSFEGFYKWMDEKRQPERLKESGLFFCIAIGSHKKAPLNSLDVASPLTEERYTNESKYYLGEMRSWEAAEKLLPVIKSKVSKNAQLAAFANGKKINIPEAKKLVKEEKYLSKSEYMKVCASETEEIESAYKLAEKTVKKDIKKKEKTKDSITVSKNGVIYKVQIGVFRDGNKFSELPEEFKLEKTKGENGVYTYTVGGFATYAEADKMKDKLSASGIKGYVVSGKIAEKKSEKAKSATKTTITYKVQIASFKGKIPSATKQKINKLSATYRVEKFNDTEGQTIYTIGKYKDYSEAVKVKDQLLKTGTEGFVVAFRGNEKISVEEAKKEDNL